MIAFHNVKNQFKLSFKDTIPFGKYFGVKVKDIIDKDPGYLAWVHLNTSYKLTNNVISKLPTKPQKSPRKYYGDYYDAEQDMYDIGNAFGGFFDDIPF
jgi:hypothetical protein